MSEQPEALRLADALEKDRWHISGVTAQRSADELRRLHEEVERLRAAVAEFVSDYENGDMGDLKHYARAMRTARGES